MNDIEALVSASEEAYRARDFGRAIVLLGEIVSSSPHSPEGLASRHLRAMAYEVGNAPGGVNLNEALQDYRELAERVDVVGSVGLIGAARVLCELDLEGSVKEIERLCSRAIELESAPAARMLLGYVASEVHRDQAEARKWFLSAFMKGSPWGMRYFAAAHWKDRNFLRGAFFHIVSAMAWPVLSLLRTTSTPYD
jgi:TPR repeat protein